MALQAAEKLITPSEATVKKAYAFLDLWRGMEAFFNGIPAMFVYA
jgi:hypothetical protein